MFESARTSESRIVALTNTALLLGAFVNLPGLGDSQARQERSEVECRPARISQMGTGGATAAFSVADAPALATLDDFLFVFAEMRAL